MDRRRFLKLTAALGVIPSFSFADTHSPQLALTFDDPRTDSAAKLSWREINTRILRTLEKRKLKAALLVCGRRIDSAEGRQLISQWNDAGHLIGNHTYSHHSLNANGDKVLADFEADTLRNDTLIRDYSNFTRLFRFPFFKEGDTREKRDGMRSFLQQHGYRSGRATIDASDWAISARMEIRTSAEPNADLTPYHDFFRQHIWERAQFYDSLAQQVWNKPVRHTVLLHHNPLNAMFLDNLIAMFMERNWKLINADEAYSDPVYDEQPNILPAGESLIWALAKQSGKFEKELRYPGEDDVYENPKMDALKL